MSNFIKRHNIVNRVAEEWFNKDFKFTVYKCRLPKQRMNMAQSGNSFNKVCY